MSSRAYRKGAPPPALFALVFLYIKNLWDLKIFLKKV
jgi:hypothetical protein